MSKFPSGFTISNDHTKDHCRPLHIIPRAQYRHWHSTLSNAQKHWLDSVGFEAAPGTFALLPDSKGLASAVLGIDDLHDPFSYAHAPLLLPQGKWTPVWSPLATPVPHALQLGWGLGAYRFEHYRKMTLRPPAQLALDGADSVDVEALDILAAVNRVRDLVNTPSEDMGPEQLEHILQQMAHTHGAQCEAITGEALLAHHFPAIYAVGRASSRAPRLLCLRWNPGDMDAQDYRHVVIVGKGVCFDTGGLDLKPADGMRWMKKDMGGAAHAIALAGLIMARRLPLRMTLLVPAVDNAIGPDAYRPGDIIRTRKGINVEIDNTDAEGRLVLCDALAYGGEMAPDLMLDFATLTGAARVALGPDLPALFSNDNALANTLLDAGQRAYDPLWRMPLWRPYLRYLTSQTGDIANAGSRMAGSVTAALYLERFIPEHTPWAHLDVYAWNDQSRPGKPQGGEALGLRAVYWMLKHNAFSGREKTPHAPPAHAPSIPN